MNADNVVPLHAGCLNDEMWFDQNPGRQYRIRKAIRGETSPEQLKRWDLSEVTAYALLNNVDEDHMVRLVVPVPEDVNPVNFTDSQLQVIAYLVGGEVYTNLIAELKNKG